MTLNDLNYLPWQDAMDWFQKTCAAQRWCQLMTDARPFASFNALEDSARRAWQQMAQDDWMQAFAAHPMIGDISSLRAKFANTKQIAANEQSSTSKASEATLQGLKKLNHDYLAKHGFIFIICATGLSAETMLAELESRLPNDTETEMKTAAEHQFNITLLRLRKGLQDEEE